MGNLSQRFPPEVGCALRFGEKFVGIPGYAATRCCTKGNPNGHCLFWGIAPKRPPPGHTPRRVTRRHTGRKGCAGMACPPLWISTLTSSRFCSSRRTVRAIFLTMPHGLPWPVDRTRRTWGAGPGFCCRSAGGRIRNCQARSLPAPSRGPYRVFASLRQAHSLPCAAPVISLDAAPLATPLEPLSPGRSPPMSPQAGARG